MYRFIVRAAAAAAAGCTVFYVMALIGVAIDPTGIAMSRRLGTILLAVIIVCALVAIHGWQVEAATRRAAAEAAQRTAAAVSTAVLGVIEQRLVAVAERTAGNAQTQLIEAITQIGRVIGGEITGSIGGQMETWLGRAHTQGMIDESRPAGSVTHLNGRRES